MSNIDISRESVFSQGKPKQHASAATPLLLADLGWSLEEAQETRARLLSLEEDWEAPGMEAYDNL